jgi:hypothetical protein
MINEMTVQNDILQSTLEDLKSQNMELSIAIEKKNNLREIEEYATVTLGMVKIDQLVKKYIIIEENEKIEVIKVEETSGGYFNTLAKNFKSLLEYFD